MNYEAGNYYTFTLEGFGKRHEVYGKLIKAEATIYPDITTLWINLPYSEAKRFSNYSVIDIKEIEEEVIA